jgi:Transposase, Mutator family
MQPRWGPRSPGSSAATVTSGPRPAKTSVPGSRNGYREVTVKTSAGPVQLARPKLRGASESFASRLFGAHVIKTNALESLVIASFVRGLSVRDVEASLAEALGDQAAISKSTVPAICQQIKDGWRPGVSPATASPRLPAWPRAPAGPPTPGTTSAQT